MNNIWLLLFFSAVSCKKQRLSLIHIIFRPLKELSIIEPFLQQTWLKQCARCFIVMAFGGSK